ncbi:BA75_00209T0 [Komagataella pastoris]|uniref:Elongin-C n=1 Tax=Komagataella pastoris TaxID=4922 RepID=A0A1B2J903_PICPA|nr:BA75_00209T0 [Komagataella pastoris]
MSDEEEDFDKEEFVTLISSDGFKFIISKEIAEVSGTLRNMLGTSFQEAESNRITLHEIDGVLMEKIIQYLHYNFQYKDQVDVPEFDIPTEMALELLVAADFLDV